MWPTKFCLQAHLGPIDKYITKADASRRPAYRCMRVRGAYLGYENCYHPGPGQAQPTQRTDRQKQHKTRTVQLSAGATTQAQKKQTAHTTEDQQGTRNKRHASRAHVPHQ